jgi:endonuclease-8
VASASNALEPKAGHYLDGRIIVVRPEHDHGSPAYGPKRPRTYVYRRTGEPCRICGAAIRTAEMEGRNLFWCPVCQT